MNTEELWDGIWNKSGQSLDEFTSHLDKEQLSLRWKKIEGVILSSYKSFKGLKVLELGSGVGRLSLLMGLKGADVSLLDYSNAALEKAKSLFQHCNCKAVFIKADIFELPKEVISGFDIAMSFGLAEHFSGKERQESINAHYLALKEKGIAFISVPNKVSFPYIIWKKKLELEKRWGYGTEIAFTRKEIKMMARHAGFNLVKLRGTSLISSINTYLLFDLISRIGINPEIPSSFDDYLGDALILIGYKNILI